MENLNSVGQTSDYNGYGTGENGVDLEKNDMDSSIYEGRGSMAMGASAEGGAPGANARAVAADLAFEQHLKDMAEANKQAAPEQSTEAAQSVVAEQPAAAQPEAVAPTAEKSLDDPTVASTPVAEKNLDQSQGGKPTEQYIDSHGVVHFSREDYLEAEAGYR